MNRRWMQWLIVVGVLGFWPFFLFDPFIAVVPIVITYLCFLLLLAIAAVEYREAGWISGLLFAVVAGTMPAWVLALYWLYAAI